MVVILGRSVLESEVVTVIAIAIGLNVLTVLFIGSIQFASLAWHKF